jgi:DNA-binding protein HU-beta
MKKAEVIKHVASATGQTQRAVADVLTALEFLSHHQARKRGEMNLGFINIKTVEKAARMGRNPSTNEPKEIPARTAVKVVVSKGLKDAARGVAS